MHLDTGLVEICNLFCTGFKFLAKVPRDVFVMTKFYGSTGVIHCLNLHIREAEGMDSIAVW